ncbi:Septal ring factor [uncultured Eubacterium sp.]|mgnify:FL=1|uniref:murein hydrolase activator EnvC family protein n=1 Tax=Brotomerdimonas butyrica TaxID=2981721 RepID=UPI00082278D7|nr:M23 family metallopeptidase [Brotomerdimonas butyrica]MCU6754758.1 peptidoglycan DD-metalloendopeptidase family protein [Brotomerdimonas butyrica]SCG92413.1 Septal ring factor [uncultured Eubacterium sp.]
MRKKRLMIIMAVLMAFLMCMQTSVASAASLSEIRDQIKQKESQLKEGQSKESDLASQMLDLEKKIQSMQDSINQLDAAISEGEAKLTTLEAELKEAEDKVQVQNDNLGSRLRNMYKNGTIGFVDVLLDSGSFTEFLTNLDMVEKVYSSDKEVLTGLQDAYDEIDKKKKEVEKLQTELNESKKVAESEKSTLEASKATVEKQKAEISASNTETQKMLDSLKADAAAMSQNAVENGSSSSDSSYTGGAMAWPVPSVGTSNITSIFGWRTHPIFGVGRGHTGVDIGASYGSSVVAANPGRVIYAGWYGGYGNCVQIDHGGGVVTLYGHNSSLNVSVGQQVSRGQTIAYIGSTGYSTGPHCHFEVILDGVQVDPLDYIL